jgi:hypothetical protein
MLVRTMIGVFSEVARILKSAEGCHGKIRSNEANLVQPLQPLLPLSSASSTLQRASVNEMSGHVDCSPFSILCIEEGSGIRKFIK